MFCAAGKENVGAYVIPSTVASLVENAFNGASTMTSVTVPESVSRLEKEYSTVVLRLRRQLCPQL